MKGLVTTSIIITALITVGIVTSVIIAGGLNSRLATANGRGFEEGRAQGYVEGFQEGSEVGYQEGSKLGYAKGSEGDHNASDRRGFYFIYNPTYDELREILADAGTGSGREIHDYAEANGVRAAYVRSQIARPAGEGMVYVYELVAFETVDKGLIIIEPWSHREVKIELGRHYHELNGFPPSPYDDTITKITIIW